MHDHLLQFSAKALIGLSMKVRERQNIEVPSCLPLCKEECTCYIVGLSQCLLNKWTGSQWEGT